MKVTNIPRNLKLLISRNFSRLFSKDFYINYSKWKKLKGKYKGRRVFLIGNGPSLNKTPLYLLKEEYTMAFNRFNIMLERLNWKPSFYMTADDVVAEDMQSELREMTGMADLCFFPDIHRTKNLNFKKFIPQKENVLFTHQEFLKFSTILPFIAPGGTVVYEGFQILKFLGFSEIFILGVDMNYVIHENANLISGYTIQSKGDDDPNHFDPRYFGKGRTYHQPIEKVIQNMLKHLEIAACKLSTDECKAVNIGYDSVIDFFSKQDFYETLGYSEKKISSLFSQLVKSHGIDSITELEKNATCLSEANSDDELTKCTYAINADIAHSLIKKNIYKYIPLGPYKNLIYFIKRDEKLIKY